MRMKLFLEGMPFNSLNYLQMVLDILVEFPTPRQVSCDRACMLSMPMPARLSFSPMALGSMPSRSITVSTSPRPSSSTACVPQRVF